MKGTHKRSIFVAAVALIAVATFLVSGQAGRALADEEAGLGDKVAGTYLAVTENGAHDSANQSRWQLELHFVNPVHRRRGHR